MSVAVSSPVQRTPDPARYHPLVVVLTAVAAGIVADRYWPLPVAVWWGMACGGLAGWFGLWRLKPIPEPSGATGSEGLRPGSWNRLLGRPGLAAVAVLSAAAATAASWHHCCWHLFAADDLGRFARSTPEPVCIEVIALRTPRALPRVAPDPLRVVESGDRVRLDVAAAAVRDGTCWRSASGQARLTVNALLPEVQAGDRLQVFAHLSLPPQPMNPGEFDMGSYQRGDRICSRLRAEFAESVSLLEAGRPWRPLRLLEQVRMHGNRLFARWLSPHHAGLAGAVLLGIREGLDPETVETFVETGTIHLLVISGLNLAILVGAVLFVLRRTPIARRWALIGAAVFAILYTLLVDTEPPVVRATVMVLIACGSLLVGRERLAFNALAAAALVVLVLNPADLFRNGAQLSFLCVACLIVVAPMCVSRSRAEDPLDRLIAENRPWPARLLRRAGRAVRDVTLVSAAVWLVTLPLVMARFHLFNPVAVLLNTLAGIPMTVAMVSGFVLLVVGSLPLPLGAPCAGVCDVSLEVLERLVRLGQRCPAGHFWVPGPPDWWLAGFYGGLGLLLALPWLLPRLLPRLRLPRRWWLAALAGWTALGFGAAWLRTDPGRFRCTFLSVGHGEAVVLELPGGRTLLYDAGQFAAPDAASRSVASMLWSRGITHLDAVVLSHGDVDHVNGLPSLLERFTVGAVYVTPVMFGRENPALQALRQAIDRAGVPTREISAGDRLATGPGCSVEVLHPPRRGVLGKDNANSLTLLVEYLDHRILLTGDLESPGLDDVLAETPRPCDVLLVPHHGSRQNNPAGLAAWSTPRWAVISGSRRWNLRPVKAIYERAGSRVLHTAETGAITATIDRRGVEVETFLGERAQAKGEERSDEEQ